MQIDDGEKWLPEMEGYLLKIEFRQFLDGKHNSKFADTVNIELRHSF